MSFRIDVIVRSFLCLVAAAWLGGCVSVPYNVTAMRFDAEPARQRRFQIAKPTITGADGLVDADELAGYVGAALLNRGFSAAPAGLPAGMVIEILFEQEPPRLEPRVGTENIYQWQPEQTVLTTKQTKTNTGLVFTEAVPKKIPAHSEAVATRPVNYLVKVFPKRLRIVARIQADPSAGEPDRPLWSVEVRHDDEVGDLARCAVQMVAAAMDHLGDDFSGEKTVLVSSGDDRMKILRKSRAPSGSAGTSR